MVQSAIQCSFKGLAVAEQPPTTSAKWSYNAKMVRWLTIGASEEEGAIAQKPAENMLDIVTQVLLPVIYRSTVKSRKIRESENLSLLRVAKYQYHPIWTASKGGNESRVYCKSPP